MPSKAHLWGHRWLTHMIHIYKVKIIIYFFLHTLGQLKRIVWNKKKKYIGFYLISVNQNVFYMHEDNNYNILLYCINLGLGFEYSKTS